MVNPRYRRLVGIAWKKWTLDQCIWIYQMGPATFVKNGKEGKSTLGMNVAKYVARAKYNVSL